MRSHPTPFSRLTRWLPLLALACLAGPAHSQVAPYTFSQPSSSGGYTAITGSAIAQATANTGALSLDDVSYPVTLPFAFNYGNSSFSLINVSTNGSISFGSNATVSPRVITDNTTGGGAIAAFNTDLRGIFITTASTTTGTNTLTGVTEFGSLAVGQTITGVDIPTGTTITGINKTAGTVTMSGNATATSTSAISIVAQSGHIDTATLGTAPNRTFIIQWTGFEIKNNPNTSVNFQIQLDEAGGVASAQTVSISYGDFVNLAATGSVQVGLRGNIGNSDFNNRTGTSWSATSDGNNNSDSVDYSSTVLPSSGLLFVYTPPADCSGAPVAGNVTASASAVCPGGSTTLTLSGASTGTGIAVQWMSSLDNVAFTPVVGANSYSYTATLGSTTMYYQAVVTCLSASPTPSNSAAITVHPVPSVFLGNDTAICPGTSVTLDAQNAGSSYLFSDNTTSQTTTINAAGRYSVAVTDGNGCVGRDTIDISTAAIPVVNLGNDTAICPGATITLDAKNPGATYLYSTSATTQTASVTAAGTYSVEVTNAQHCVGRDTIVLTQGVVPVVNLGNDTTICPFVLLTLSAGNPGSTYEWSTTAVTGMTATTPTVYVDYVGFYFLAVTNGDKCVGRDTIYVSGDVNPVVNLGNDTTICPGATITLDAGNPGSTYLYSDAVTTRTNTVTTGGTYIVAVTNPNKCTARDTIVIAQGVTPVVALGNDTIVCPGATITLDAGNAGSTYLYNTSATTQTLNVTASGTYSVTVKNSGNCIGGDTIVIAQGVTPVVNLGADTAICPGAAAIQLDAANPGDTYLYNTGATTRTLSVTAGGTYSVAVKNSGNCIGRDTIEIVQGVLPVVALGNDTVLCPAATITLNAGNPGATYLYAGGATTQTLAVTSAGAYSVLVTDANKCMGRDTIVITAGVEPVVDLGNDTLVCPGDMVSLNAGNAGSTYLYSTGATTRTLAVTTGGTYSVQVTNADKCVGRDTVLIATGVNPAPGLGNDTVICPAATITLNGGNFGTGFAYLYNTGATTQTINVTAAGTYILRVTNTTTGCRGRDTIVITADSNPVVNLGNDTIVCPTKVITLDAGNAGSTYLYNTGATTRTLAVTGAGTYSVLVTNVNNCVSRDTIVITQGTAPVVYLGRDTSACANVAITLDAGNPGSTYLYSTGATTRTLSVLPAGIYSVIVTNAQKCQGFDTIDVTMIPTASVNLVSHSKNGTAVTFGSDAMSAATYAWSFGDGGTDNVPSPVHNYVANGVYNVRLIVTNQCGSDTATTSVTISGLGAGSVSLSNDELGLYPNPATNSVTLNNRSALKMQSVTVLNSLGTVVLLKDGVAPKKETLDLSALPAGTYMVRIQTDGGTFLRKLALVK